MTAIWNTRFQREMLHAEYMDRPFKWGNIADLDPARVEKVGIRAARLEARDASASLHRNSSGRTASLVKEGKTRKERNAIRRAHYTRKAELKAYEERIRRERWERRHETRGARESNWERRERAHWQKRHPGKGSANWRAHWSARARQAHKTKKNVTP